jgi:hypothetical protein
MTDPKRFWEWLAPHRLWSRPRRDAPGQIGDTTRRAGNAGYVNRFFGITMAMLVLIILAGLAHLVGAF